MEEEVNENVKTKAPVMNKHLIMGLAMVIIVAVIIAVVALANKEKVVDYKEQIKEFAKACESDEKMEAYVKQYVNLRAYFAMQYSKTAEDVEKNYKISLKEDYESATFVNKVNTIFKMYSSIGTALNVTDIGEMEELDSSDGKIIGEDMIKLKELKKAKFTVESEGQTVDLYALFYKGKILMVTATEGSL